MVGFLRGRLRVRVAVVVFALLALQVGSLVAPAYACGCGALVPGDQQRVTVGREVSVVRWDGRQEQIVMSLSVGGDADRAAWIMPVPRRATVKLGDPDLFDQLSEATGPEYRTRYHFWPQDGDWPLTTGDGAVGASPPPPGAGAGVGVVGRERIGPFDVARLTAGDPSALDDWLRGNDFGFPSRLEEALQPYVDRRWEYVAVRLAPETADGPLNGILDPLHLTFASERPVYPMRLSRLATTPQSLGLYVLAAHRMEPGSAIGGERPRVTFAGPVTAKTGPLAALAENTPFLTAVGQEFPTPSAISGDHELRRAPQDNAFRQVVYEDRLRTVAGIPAWLLTVVGGIAAVATTAITLAVRGSRSRRRAAGVGRHAAGATPGGSGWPGTGVGAGAQVPAVPGAPEAMGAAGSRIDPAQHSAPEVPPVPPKPRSAPQVPPMPISVPPEHPMTSSARQVPPVPQSPPRTTQRPTTPPSVPAPSAPGSAPAPHRVPPLRSAPDDTSRVFVSRRGTPGESWSSPAPPVPPVAPVPPAPSTAPPAPSAPSAPQTAPDVSAASPAPHMAPTADSPHHTPPAS